ncbi:MAG TPA: hypothetical protein VIN34_06775 [Candidatus Limnocylindria bacterium]
MGEPAPELDLSALLRTLTREKVKFLIIGGIAGALHGSTTMTSDLDILYARDRENVRRLAAALARLDARRRDLPAGVAAPVDAASILNGLNLLLVTRFGDLDCLGETPSGRFTYEQLVVTAERYEIAEDLQVSVVSLEELIRMKRATGRAQDRAEVERLAALRDELEDAGRADR